MEDNALNLDPNAITDPPPGDTPPNGDNPPAAPGGDQPPKFSLVIDERTRYEDPEKAKEGWRNLSADRDTHKQRAETLEQENKRLRMIAAGLDPEKPKPEETLTPAQIQAQREWFSRVAPHLKIPTLDQVDERVAQAFEEREQERLVQQGQRHLDVVLKDYGLEMTAAERDALENYLGNFISHPDNQALQRRFVAGDMKVLDEIVEKMYSAHIESRRKATQEREADEARKRDQRGRFSRVEQVKDKMQTAVPSGPTKGTAAAVTTGEPAKLQTSEQRKKRIEELLQQTA